MKVSWSLIGSLLPVCGCSHLTIAMILWSRPKVIFYTNKEGLEVIVQQFMNCACPTRMWALWKQGYCLFSAMLIAQLLE